MSRVGKNPVAIPAGVEVTQAGESLSVKGKLGSGSYGIPEGILVSLEGGKVTLTLAAKTTEAHKKLIEMFSLRAIEKTYLAISCGNPCGQLESRLIDLPLGRNRNFRQKMAV